ncbi:acyltransferase, partial [Microbacteriaceae bacterium K1510]|nr:acyltransferase [Microbacteriaceae bacterium K1510]
VVSIEIGKMQYRPEIDGLRAVSVLAVVFYHLGFSWMPGGFVGVDVFFVISGYLITIHLAKKYARQPHGLVRFYGRRIARLGPALLVMVTLCVAAGYFILAPGDYRVLSISSLYTLIAGSNVYFLHNTGYFDASSQSMPLLHTWSLAVEEQFYLVWPLALVTLGKMFRSDYRWLIAAVAALTVLSFSLNLYAVGTKEMAGFYLAHNRAWELLAGCVLALWTIGPGYRVPRIVAALLPMVGLGAIYIAATHLAKDSSYPGYRALLPVLGAAAFLLPIGNVTLVFRVMGSAIPAAIGKLSYSLYLYHWPILVFWLHYSSFEPMSDAGRFGILGVSFVASWLSLKFVEKPLRESKARIGVVFGSVMGAGAIAAAGWIIVSTHGLPERIPEAVQAVSSMETMLSYNGCPDVRPGNDCETGVSWNAAKHRIVIIGDSNAEHFLPMLATAAEGHDISIRLLFGCSPVVDGNRTIYYGDMDPLYSQKCGAKREKMLAALRSDPNVSMIVLASAWWNVSNHLVVRWFDPATREQSRRLLKDGIDNLLADLSFVRAPIMLISAIPAWGINPVPCVVTQETSLLRKPCLTNTDRFDIAYFNSDQKDVAEVLRSYSGLSGVSVLSPEDYVCNGKTCVSRVNGEFLYSDQWHLRRNLKPGTRAELAKLLRFDKIVDAAEKQPILAASSTVIGK